MARNRRWPVAFYFLLGIAASTAFWLYAPLNEHPVFNRQAIPLKTAVLAHLPDVLPQASCPRYQMIADGKHIFFADLEKGRVWRYFHNTGEDGTTQEEEGFWPICLNFAGKRYYGASEIASAMPQFSEVKNQAPEGRVR
jgi:hypothetical protein